ncbi:universal stress protein [Bifidobacterium tsurumiense]|uniref:universal stress protein n=1 Tax=Bifidobacterium tsurumiense TaxID=356829 RepID=UPI0012B1DE14|nr:universal stress protein [Bifidobacterium tsurumiense]MSS12846.1 universal stress protein [Bifidobacterium tsurumiense]
MSATDPRLPHSSAHADDAALSTDIVVGVDGSDESFVALQWALKEAVLSGQKVNAVFGWTPSWGLGAQPETEDEWLALRREIIERLRRWSQQACIDIGYEPKELRLTSVKASGASALLRIGAHAQQIVVGRRSLNRVTRWFTGSTSASLVEASKVPVTVVRLADDDEPDVRRDIANALSASNTPAASAVQSFRYVRPVVAGVDGSPTSRRVLEYAMRVAQLHHAALHVMMCWQLKDLGTLMGYERAIPPISVGQEHAEALVKGLLDDVDIPQGLHIVTHAFHIAATNGLEHASRYADHMIVGARGLTGLNARILGSVSRHVVETAECTVTVVR